MKKILFLLITIIGCFSLFSCESKIPKAKVTILKTGQDVIVWDNNLEFIEKGQKVQLFRSSMDGRVDPWSIQVQNPDMKDAHSTDIDSSDKQSGWHIFSEEYVVGIIKEKY